MTLTDRKNWIDGILGSPPGKYPERRESFRTSSGISIPDVALPAADPDPAYAEKLGLPGEYPYTRGIRPTMYRGRLWTMRQYAGYATAEESNCRFRYLLENGQTGLSVAFDLPTQIGYDADHPLAAGEVGRVGAAVSSLDDMIRLFDGIPFDQVSTSLTINAPAAILLAMYVAAAKRQGVEIANLRGTVQNDVLKEYVARGTYIFPAAPSMRLVTDIFQYCAREIPNWNTISISGYHIREAGANAVQEVAFTLVNAIAYVEAALAAGLHVDDIAPQLSFFFAAHNNLLEEVAKFRAARRLWARIMNERFGAQKPASLKLRFHAQTAGSTLTAQQPENNAARVTLQALAAILGGTQSLHTNSMDEALCLPTEKSVRLALRTQQIIAHESGVADTIDPLAGSYFVEGLTDEIERRVIEIIQKVDSLGGALAAIEQGYIQEQIQQSAYEAARAVETGVQVVVGVNKFRAGEDIPLENLKVDPAIEATQKARLQLLREKRDGGRASELLGQLECAARGTENLVPLFVTMVENDITLGEICGVLRGVWGEYEATVF
jgi:methylmalonyl-CoA mutase N-terminal domain/subunit